MQRPTCENIHVRTANDALLIFVAIQHGYLKMITRRLDNEEKSNLRSGCVYAWEERSTSTEVTGLGMERFTDGRRWSASRVREEFLFYEERYTAGPSRPAEPPKDWIPLIKQTYSAFVRTASGSRKWHINAYYTEKTVERLRTIDSLSGLHGIRIPPEMFSSARAKTRLSRNDEPRGTENARSSDSRTVAIAAYYLPAVMPAGDQPLQEISPQQQSFYKTSLNDYSMRGRHSEEQWSTKSTYPRHQLNCHIRSPAASAKIPARSPPAIHEFGRDLSPASSTPSSPASSTSSDGRISYSAERDVPMNYRELAPLEALQRAHPYRREPTDDQALRSLRSRPS